MLVFRRKNSNIFIGKYMEFTLLAMLFLNETFYGIFKHCGLFTSVIGLYLKNVLVVLFLKCIDHTKNKTCCPYVRKLASQF